MRESSERGFVIVSTDGLFEPEDFYTYAEAVARLRELQAECRSDGFEIEGGIASRDNLAAFRASRAGFRSLCYEIVKDGYDE